MVASFPRKAEGPRFPVREGQRMWPRHCVRVVADTLPLCVAGLHYVLTADVAQKEKGQSPRVYFVLPGESAGQVSEKLRLVHMEETCRHYVAHVKVSPFRPQTLISTDVRLEP